MIRKVGTWDVWIYCEEVKWNIFPPYQEKQAHMEGETGMEMDSERRKNYFRLFSDKSFLVSREIS